MMALAHLTCCCSSANLFQYLPFKCPNRMVLLWPLLSRQFAYAAQQLMGLLVTLSSAVMSRCTCVCSPDPFHRSYKALCSTLSLNILMQISFPGICVSFHQLCHPQTCSYSKPRKQSAGLWEGAGRTKPNLNEPKRARHCCLLESFRCPLGALEAQLGHCQQTSQCFSAALLGDEHA